MNAPAFQFYADDFLAGTIAMTPAEVGTYIRLLCYQWSSGSIPDDPRKLRQIAGGNVSPDVLAKFPPAGEGLRANARLERVRAEQREHRESKVKAGRNGAKKRWQNHGSAILLPMAEPTAEPMAGGMAKDSSPSPTPTPNTLTQSTINTAPMGAWDVAPGVALPVEFRTPECKEAVLFWLAYKKEARQAYKPQGLKALMSLIEKDFTPETLIQAVRKSAAAGWRGLFPPKADSNNSGSNRYATATPDDAPF